MFVHCVHFWLKPDLTTEQRASFLAGLKHLETSPNVADLRVGTPAGTPRPIVDNSYDYQLLMRFRDQAAHDAYQSADDSIHQAFIKQFKPLWTRVLVYDSIEV